MRVQDEDQDVVFRSTGAVVLAWAWYVVAAVALVDLVWKGARGSIVTGACVLAFVTVAVFMLAHRPAVVAGRDGVLLRNVVKDVFVPWVLVSHVDRSWSLVLETTEGARYPSWAVSGGSPAKQSRQARKAARETERDAAPAVPEHLKQKDLFGQVADNLRWMRERAMHRPDVGPEHAVATRTVWPLVAALVASGVAVVLAVVL